MKRFADAREAKEYLISGIVAEAQRENVPLSEVERKMLYFSETGWTLPDIMDVNDAFDREYDQAQSTPMAAMARWLANSVWGNGKSPGRPPCFVGILHPNPRRL